MLTLFCAIVGMTEDPFPVGINENKTVGELKVVIKEAKSNDLKHIDANNLWIYLAKKSDGAWLTASDTAVLELAKGETHKDIEMLIKGERLRATQNLTSVLEKMPILAAEQLHVLVGLSEQREACKPSALNPLLMADYDRVVPTKPKRYVHSKMSSREERELLGAMEIHLLPHTVPVSVQGQDFDQVEAFRWEAILNENDEEAVLLEQQQRQRYLKYVEDNINDVLKAEDLCVIAVEKDRNILSVALTGYDIELVGNADLLVMSALVKEFPHYVSRLTGVRMLIEAKRDGKTNRGAISRALSKLIALDVLANDLVMALLTNLTDYWEFFWVSMSNDHVSIKHVILTDPSSAFAMIRAILTQSPMADDSLATSDEISLPWLGEPVKRFKLDDLLPISDNTAILEAIEQYHDIASVLGPDEDMARALGRQIARSIPIFSMYACIHKSGVSLLKNPYSLRVFFFVKSA